MQLLIPDIGDFADVEIIEVLIVAGQQINQGDSVLTLQSDKASIEIPAEQSGIVGEVVVKIGDKVSTGDQICSINQVTQSTAATATADTTTIKPAQTQTPAAPPNTPSATAVSNNNAIDMYVPDIGDFADVEIIEVLIRPDDKIEVEQSVITLQSDKASMEIPATVSGKVIKVLVSPGDLVSTGSKIATIQSTIYDTSTTSVASNSQSAKSETIAQPATQLAPKQIEDTTIPTTLKPVGGGVKEIYAGPAVRRLLREYNVDPQEVPTSGPKGRMLKQDVKNYIKKMMGKQIIDSGRDQFAQADDQQIRFLGQQLSELKYPEPNAYGEVSVQKLSRIAQLSGPHLHRSWLTVPHVTQFAKANMSDLENLRRTSNKQIEKRGFKITPLAFFIKAITICLQEFPVFCASLDKSGENLLLKQYYNIGIAVNTVNGLMVPVIKNADQLRIIQLADEAMKLSTLARNGKISREQLQGGCFTISSLGSIGGDYFTPIINHPELAILGLGRARTEACWDETSQSFVPRLMQPLSLSYNHRAIDGVMGAQFITRLVEVLENFSSSAI